MTTMQAAVVKEFGKDLSVEDVPVPEPAVRQVLVKLVSSTEGATS